MGLFSVRQYYHFFNWFILNLEGLCTSLFNYGIKTRDPQSQKEKTEFGKIPGGVL